MRFFPPRQPNELVPGLGVGHDGPIRADAPAAAQWNAPWFDLAPRAGLLLLFPASVDHAVLENEDPDDSRFSISLDLVLTRPERGRGCFRGVSGAPSGGLAGGGVGGQGLQGRDRDRAMASK